MYTYSYLYYVMCYSVYANAAKLLIISYKHASIKTELSNLFVGRYLLTITVY